MSGLTFKLSQEIKVSKTASEEESVVPSGLWKKSSLKKWIPKEDVIEKKTNNSE